VRIFATPKPKPTIPDLRREFAEARPDELLPRAVTAAGIGYSLSWLELAATKGGGPPYFKRGRRVLYKKADVLVWMEENSQRVRSTSEYPPKPSKASAAASRVEETQ
jgi:hypothetical protein